MSMTDFGPQMTAPSVRMGTTTPRVSGHFAERVSAAQVSRREAFAREVRTHVGFAVLLLPVWLVLPAAAVVGSILSPSLAQVTALDSTVNTVAPADLPALHQLLLLGLACVVATSFCARMFLIPGQATGDVGSDIVARRSVHIGAAVAAVNFIALTFYTAALAEAWIFPLLTFSTCHVIGIYIERLRHNGDLP